MNLKTKNAYSVGHRMLVKAPVVAVCILLALLRDLLAGKKTAARAAKSVVLNCFKTSNSWY